MSTSIIGVQRRLMELGRIRLGEKGPKGEPRRLTTFRLTSASRPLLEAAAVLYGGTVREWRGAPDEGYFELTTTSDQLDVLIPPGTITPDGEIIPPYSQVYELWSGGGCQRRCDGRTEALSGKPCLCDPDERECQITTRVNVMLPRVPGLGVWRLESHGWNAAVYLPGTLDLLSAAGSSGFMRAVLRIEQRTVKRGGQTRRFIVPIIDLPELTVEQMVAQPPMARLGPVNLREKVDRPALPAGADLPTDTSFGSDGGPNLPEPPPLPSPDAPAEPPGDGSEAAVAAPARSSRRRARPQSEQMPEGGSGVVERDPTGPSSGVPSDDGDIDLVQMMRDAAVGSDLDTPADSTQRLAIKTLFEKSPGHWAVPPSTMRELSMWTFAIADSSELTQGMAAAILSVAESLGKETFLRHWAYAAIVAHNAAAGVAGAAA